MTRYAIKCDENATMSFRVNIKQLLKNYNKILEKFEKLIKILKANLFMMMSI